jgi:hypothetical protein
MFAAHGYSSAIQQWSCNSRRLFQEAAGHQCVEILYLGWNLNVTCVCSYAIQGQLLVLNLRSRAGQFHEAAKDGNKKEPQGTPLAQSLQIWPVVEPGGDAG